MRYLPPHVVVLLLAVMLRPAFATAQEIPIATGSEDSVYHAMGQALVRLMSEYDIAEAKVVVTEGTMDNLRLLRSGEADLALVQSDVLATEPAPNLRALGALFPEYTQILVRSEDSIYRPVHLVDQRLFLGESGSGTRRNANDILRALRIDPEYYQDLSDHLAADEAIDALLEGQVDAVFWTGSDLIVDHPEVRGRLRMLTLSEEDQHRIRGDRANRYSGFMTVSDVRGNQVTAMFTRAILVLRAPRTNPPLNDGQVTRLLEAISTDLEVAANQIYGRHIAIFQSDQSVRGIPIPLHRAAERHYRQEGMLPNIANLFIISSGLWLLLCLVALLRYGTPPGPIAAIGDWVDERLGSAWKGTKFLAASPMMLSLWVLVALLVTNVLVIIRFESVYSFHEHTSNPFADRTIVELLTWLVTFAGTGVDLGLYPQSLQGRIAAALIPLSGFVYAILLVAYTCIQKIRRDDLRARGICPTRLRGHVIICGWNRRVPRMIREITSTMAWRKSRKVLVLAEHDDDKPLAGYGFAPRAVHYLRGISSDYATLEKAGIDNASCVVIVADDRKVQQDNRRGVFTAMAVKNQLERAKRRESVRIIAELFHEGNESAFRLAGADKIVNLHRISIRFMFHACLNPGVSDLVSMLLSFTSQQSITLQPVTGARLARHDLVGKTYDQALTRLREHNLLLLAIYREPNGGLVHEPSELDFKSTGSPYLVNPTAVEDRSRRIVATDRVLVLRNMGAGSQIKLDLGRKLQQYETTRCFHPGNEHVLVIGPSDDGFLASMGDVFNGRAERVIFIDPTSEETEVVEDGPVLRCRLSKNDPREFDKLVGEEGGEFFHEFKRITRALILCPDGREVKQAGNPIYQDDRTMAICIAVKEVYERKFGLDLHVVAELRCESNLQLFRDVGIVQPVPAETLVDLIISRMVFHGGLVTEFLLKSLSYRTANQKVRLEKCPVESLDETVRERVVGKTFDDVLGILRSSDANMQLLAFVRCAGQGDIIINPMKGSDEAAVTLRASDSIFVFRPVEPVVGYSAKRSVDGENG